MSAYLFSSKESPADVSLWEFTPRRCKTAKKTDVVDAETKRKPKPKDDISSKHQMTFCLGIACLISKHIISHPCIVLRRQCQVNSTSRWYHLTPISLLAPVSKMVVLQSFSSLWKGLTSVFVVTGSHILFQSFVFQFLDVRETITPQTPIKTIFKNLGIKAGVCALLSPLYASSFVETIQSCLASDSSGILDIFKDAGFRISSSFFPSPSTPSRLVTVWNLMPSSTVYLISKYVISGFCEFLMLRSMQKSYTDNKRAKQALSKLHPQDEGDRIATLSSKIKETLAYDLYPQLISSFTGYILADFLLYPLETIVHRLEAQGTRSIIDNLDNGLQVLPINSAYEGFFSCVEQILSNEGFPGFYKGFGALILQTVLQFALFKISKNVINSIVTD